MKSHENNSGIVVTEMVALAKHWHWLISYLNTISSGLSSLTLPHSRSKYIFVCLRLSLGDKVLEVLVSWLIAFRPPFLFASKSLIRFGDKVTYTLNIYFLNDLTFFRVCSKQHTLAAAVWFGLF